jgi:hypothetical protein
VLHEVTVEGLERWSKTISLLESVQAGVQATWTLFSAFATFTKPLSQGFFCKQPLATFTIFSYPEESFTTWLSPHGTALDWPSDENDFCI